MSRAALILTAALTGAVAVPALAAKAPAVDQAAVVGKVTECRKIADGPARLACYDSAVAEMQTAQEKGDLVTVDREQRQSIRRQAFGLQLPSLSLFDKGEKAEEVNVQTFKVDGARMNADGRWIVTLEGGQVWRQIDNNAIYNGPHSGSSVVIRKGAIGSFTMKVDGQQAVKVHRDQ